MTVFGRVWAGAVVLVHEQAGKAGKRTTGCLPEVFSRPPVTGDKQFEVLLYCCR